MISQYFPASGRSLNHAKKPSYFVKFKHAKNEWPVMLDLNAARYLFALGTIVSIKNCKPGLLGLKRSVFHDLYLNVILAMTKQEV